MTELTLPLEVGERSASSAARRSPDPLCRDERGAIMLLGVFMAIFMAGCLFYLVGIGRTLVYRSEMQDAADAAAMASAIVHAKGMNALVFINVVMAALLSVLVALRLISTLTTAVTYIGTLACPSYLGYLACPLASAAGNVTNTVEQIYSKAESPVQTALKALHGVEVVIRVTVPVLATAKSFDAVGTHYGGIAEGGVAIPPRLTLPVEDDTYTTLCKQAGNFTGALVAAPLNAIPGIGEVMGTFVTDAVGALAESVPSWFCGSEDSEAPSTEREHDMYYPPLESSDKCAADTRKSTTSQRAGDEATAQASCEEAKRDSIAATPDKNSGECTQRCDDSGPYAERTRKARADCNPNRHGKLTDYEYQKRTVRQHLVRVGRSWELDREEVLERSYHKDSKMPCKQQRGGKTEWNEDMGAAVCELSRRRSTPSRTRAIVEIEEVSQVFSCSRKEKITLQPSTSGVFFEDRVGQDSASPVSGSHDNSNNGKDNQKQDKNEQQQSNMNPQKVEEGLHNGDGDFQLRAVVLGKDLTGRLDRLVSVSTRKDTESLYKQARVAGRLSVAQAEYYYAGDDPPELMMWRMKWTARLRRFRLATDGGDSGEGKDSDSSNQGMGGLVGGLSDVPGLQESGVGDLLAGGKSSDSGSGGAEKSRGSGGLSLGSVLEALDSLVVH